MYEEFIEPNWREPYHADKEANNLVSLVDHPVAPNMTMYQCMRQDHSAVPIKSSCKPNGQPTGEGEAERLVIKHCLKVNKIHWGILEHPHYTIGLYGFPRWAILQLRTHRNTTWDVQSMRETGNQIAEDGRELYQKWASLHGLFRGETWFANQAEERVARHFALEWFNVTTEVERVTVVNSLAYQMMEYYSYSTQPGFKHERGRGILGDSVRCNAHVTMNLRHLLHVASVRMAGNAQDCTREIARRMLDAIEQPHPGIVDWFMKKEPYKLTLSP